MWRNRIPLENATLRRFEEKFRFRIEPAMREFILNNNGGYPSSGNFPTAKVERKLEQLLDFNDMDEKKGAWAINKRLREQIGEKRIIIGVDSVGNFVCLERDHKQQRIVVWSHITGTFDACLLDIPLFLRYIS